MTPFQKKTTLSIVRDLLSDSTLVNSEQLLSDIIQEWGGTKMLAKDIKAAFDEMPQGSMIRQRFFEMFQRLIINNTDRDISKEIDPSEFTDEELAQAARGVLGRTLGTGNGEEEAEAAAAQRGVEDELQRPDREEDMPDSPGFGPPGLEQGIPGWGFGPPPGDDGGWDDYGK